MPRDFVDLRHFEAELAALAGDPETRLFPAGSVTDRVGRESCLLLTGGRAALMQLAHPFVARAVGQHSKVVADVQRRFRNTLGYVYALTFGPRAEAFEIARKIHRLHARIQGTFAEPIGHHAAGAAYRANHLPALYWVAVTLWQTSMLGHDRFLTPLTAAEKDRYLVEGRRFGQLFGIPADYGARTWAELEAYVDDMLVNGELAVGPEARALADAVLTPPNRAAAPFFAWTRIFTAGLLPEPLRVAFGLPFGPAERAVFAASEVALRRVLPRLPAVLRYPPAWHRARARETGGPAPGRLVRVMPRVALRLLAPGRRRERPGGAGESRRQS